MNIADAKARHDAALAEYNAALQDMRGVDLAALSRFADACETRAATGLVLRAAVLRNRPDLAARVQDALCLERRCANVRAAGGIAYEALLTAYMTEMGDLATAIHDAAEPAA